jgi:hypothetical protein
VPRALRFLHAHGGGYDEEYADLEPFFYGEAEAVADHARQMRRKQKEARLEELRKRGYRCPFGPPGPALARARGGPLIFVPGRPGTIIHRARAVLAHGLGGGSPSPGPSGRFGPG